MPDTGPPSPPDFTGTEEELHSLISNARFSATMQEASGAPWVASVRHILDAIYLAILHIKRTVPSDPEYVARRANVAASFLATIRNLSLDFIRDNDDLFRSKFLKKEEFRELLIVSMGQLDHPSPPFQEEWGPGESVSIASFLLTGSILFPVLAKYTDSELGELIYADLGADFAKKNTDHVERAREVLRAAGIDRKSRDNLIGSAEGMRKTRAQKRATQGGGSIPKARKKRRR